MDITPEEAAKEWADDFYEKRAESSHGQYSESELWENRYYNYLEGYKAGQASHPKREQGMKWVKAGEGLPKNCGEENSVIIRGTGFSKDKFGHSYNVPFVTKGFKNFDQDNPLFYFLIGSESFLTNENIEWLDESIK